MSRYIDADKIQYRNGIVTRIAIEEIPTADVKPIVYGEWIYTGDMFNDGELVCSECGHKIDVADKSHFCPMCGVDMRKKREEEE